MIKNYLQYFGCRKENVINENQSKKKLNTIETTNLDSKTFENLNHLNLAILNEALYSKRKESFSPKISHRFSIFKKRGSKATNKNVINEIDHFLENIPRIELKLVHKDAHFLTLFMNFGPLFFLWNSLPSSMKFLENI